uniref:Sodium channel modifier 1 n=1 Tax=Oncorhynchus tshawytscha TaxID=74940 RepID=A0A8C8CMA3_ONCTS
MSFKREGNDQSQSNIFKKRRVTELLSNFIPEDEVALMKNGRYTCLVCSYRLVFDTVDMLTLHRKGKIPFLWMKWFYVKLYSYVNRSVDYASCCFPHRNPLVLRSQPTATQESEPMTAQRRIQYAILTFLPPRSFTFCLSAGRLQDRSDPWVKDENMEFDSTEEDPSSLPSSH